MSKFILISVVLFSQLVFAQDYTAIYEFPNIENQIYAQYEIAHFQVTKDEQAVHISYDMPELLTGVKNSIELSGPVQNQNVQDTVLIGPLADAHCDFVSSFCKIKFHDLKIDSALAVEKMKLNSLPAEDIESRLDVLTRFSGDPIGVIYFFNK